MKINFFFFFNRFIISIGLLYKHGWSDIQTIKQLAWIHIQSPPWLPITTINASAWKKKTDRGFVRDYRNPFPPSSLNSTTISLFLLPSWLDIYGLRPDPFSPPLSAHWNRCSIAATVTVCRIPKHTLSPLSLLPLIQVALHDPTYRALLLLHPFRRVFYSSRMNTLPGFYGKIIFLTYKN